MGNYYETIAKMSLKNRGEFITEEKISSLAKIIEKEEVLSEITSASEYEEVIPVHYDDYTVKNEQFLNLTFDRSNCSDEIKSTINGEEHITIVDYLLGSQNTVLDLEVGKCYKILYSFGKNEIRSASITKCIKVRRKY